MIRFGLVVAVLIALISLSACDGGKIQGTVVDDFGNPLEGVDVAIMNTEMRTKTDSEGRYKVSYVPGRFEVRFQKDGYEPVSIWLEFATRESVPVSRQTLQSKKAREVVFGAFAKAIDFLHAQYVDHYRAKNQLTARVQKDLEDARSSFLANIRKAKFGARFMSHVKASPFASTVIMTAPAYVKLGFTPLLTFDGSDLIEVPPDVRAYVERQPGCEEIIRQAMDGTIRVDDPKFLTAAEGEICYLTYSGAGFYAVVALHEAGIDLSEDAGSLRDIRKMAAESARTARH